MPSFSVSIHPYDEDPLSYLPANAVRYDEPDAESAAGRAVDNLPEEEGATWILRGTNDRCATVYRHEGGRGVEVCRFTVSAHVSFGFGDIGGEE